MPFLISKRFQKGHSLKKYVLFLFIVKKRGGGGSILRGGHACVLLKLEREILIGGEIKYVGDLRVSIQAFPNHLFSSRDFKTIEVFDYAAAHALVKNALKGGFAYQIISTNVIDG